MRTGIWIADDDAEEIESYIEALELMGVNQPIKTFLNGRALLEAFTNPQIPKPKHLIIDSRMPILGGPEVIRFILLHKLMSRLHILMWSEVWSPVQQSFCKSNQITCKKKPDAFAELLHVLTEFLSDTVYVNHK